MRRSIVALATVALVAAGVYAVVAGHRARTSSARSAQAEASEACGPSDATASNETFDGKVAGRFDPAMSGPCQFACATKLDYDAKEVQPQPWAATGKLTQCPVSGVVFAVGADRPHVPIAGEMYVTCCQSCANKLERDPGRYLKL